MKKKNYFCLLSLFCFLCTAFFSACTTSKNISTNYVYFQNGIDTFVAAQKERIIQPNDQLFIQVFSKTTNQEQAVVFNLTNNAGNGTQGSIASPNAPNQGYQVRLNGTIEMPVIGHIEAEGLTKYDLEKILREKLKDYVKNPLVLVRFLQFNVNVLGEVRAPGIQQFSVDNVTIIDALSAAGDLTDFGRRENVTVIREQAGKRNYYTIDLRNKNLFESPVYLLQPDDIIYVSPNSSKLKSLNIDPEAQRRTGLIFSIAGTIIGVATLLITTFR